MKRKFVLYLNISSREPRQFYSCCKPSKLCEADTVVSPFLLILPEEKGRGRKRVWQTSNRGQLHSFINQVQAFWKMFLFGCNHLFFGVNLHPVAGFCERKQWAVVAPSPPLWEPLSEGCEDDAGLYQPDKERGFRVALERICGSRVCRFGQEELWNTAEALDGILRVQCQTFCCFLKIF